MFDRLSDELPATPEDVSPGAGPGARTTAVPPALPGASLAEAEAELASVADSDLADGTGAAGEAGAESYHFSAEDIEKVFIDARDWQKQYGGRSTPSADASADASGDLSAADASQLVVDEPEGVEDITLEGLKVEIESETGESTHLEAEFDYIEDEDLDDLDSTSRLRTLENVPDSAYPEEDAETGFYRALMEGRELPSLAPAAAAAVAATVASTHTPAPAQAPAPVTPIRAERRATPAERWSDGRDRRTSDDDLAGLDLTRVSVPQRGGRWLGMGSALLVIALAVQVTHHFRQDIVRHPQAGPALRQVYDVIGQPLSPNWDLDAFEVNQWGPNEDIAPGAALTVRASLINRAGHAQPYPLLRLEFEDRFGATVAQRDFTPGEYLKSPSQAARQLAAGEATEAELSVLAPGADAEGYRLDVCLRENAGRIRCAHGG